jgi:hypothetical protein
MEKRGSKMIGTFWDNVRWFVRIRNIGFDAQRRANSGGQVSNLLLEPSDVPALGLTVTRDRSYKTSLYGDHSDEGERARKMGSITLQRTLKGEADGRTVQLLLIPYASNEDARTSLDRFPAPLIRPPFMKGRLLFEHPVLDTSVDALSEDLTFESRYDRRDGFDFVRVVGRTHKGANLFSMFGSQDEFWTWEEVHTVVEAWSQKLS